MESSSELLPRATQLTNYPVVVTAVLMAFFVGLLLFLSFRYDTTRGTLTISLLVVATFVGSLALALRFQIPQDPETAALIGGVIAAMGGVVTYWLTPRGKD